MTGVARALLGLTVSAVLFLGTAEGIVRIGRPVPRMPIFHLPTMDVRWIDGEPVWDIPGHRIPHDADCPTPDGQVVMVLSDSVLTASAPREQTVGPRLGALLTEQLGHPVCVPVAGQPAMMLRSQIALARTLAETHPPDAVVVAVWRTTETWAVAGDYLFNTTWGTTTPSGLPSPPLPIPEALHRALLATSAAWRFTTVAVIPHRNQPDGFALSAYRDLLDWTDTLGVPVLLARMPELGHPLDEAPATRGGGIPGLHALAERRGAAWLEVGPALAAAGFTAPAIRADTCCHYVPEGHAAVASVLQAPVAALLTPEPPADRQQP